MKKLVSLVLAVVLMVSVFAMLGSFTASAESYEITKTLVNLTFDGDAPYGIPAHRNISAISYETDEGYLMLKNAKGNGSMAFFGKNGNVGENPLVHNKNNAAAEEAAYNDLFIFEAGKTYVVTVDYKYLAGTTATTATPSFAVFTNPLEDTADPNRNLGTRVASVNNTIPKITYTLTEGVLAEDTDWATIKLTFTTKDDEAGFALGTYGGYSDNGDIYTAYDNFKVEEVLGSYSYTETDVYTMDNNEVVDMSSTTVTYEDDAEKGKVAKIVGTAGGRAYIPGTPTLKENTKYYVTFDAKGIAEGNYLNLGMGRVSTPGACRMFFMGYSDVSYGAKFYINGVETAIKDGFTNVKTTWQSYGLVIDTSHPDFVAGAKQTAQTLFPDKNTVHVFFGAANSTVYFDNIKIVEMGKLDTAAPEADESAKYSIREADADKTAGLRFRGTVAADVKATADEIGFVVVPSDVALGDADWYKLDSLNASAKTAKAYVKDGKDVVYEETAEGYSYQLILSGLSNAQGQNIFARRFAAVMYVKTGDAYSYISLGEISYNQVMAEYAVRGY